MGLASCRTFFVINRLNPFTIPPQGRAGTAGAVSAEVVLHLPLYLLLLALHERALLQY
jgi:hypothetical protein